MGFFIRDYENAAFRDYESVPCLFETNFVSVSESVGASTTASLPHTKAAQKAAWHLTKGHEKIRNSPLINEKPVPLYTEKGVTVRLPEGEAAEPPRRQKRAAA